MIAKDNGIGRLVVDKYSLGNWFPRVERQLVVGACGGGGGSGDVNRR